MPHKLNTQSESDSTETSEVIVNKDVENLGENPTHHKQTVMDGVDRHEMIAMTAYYRAEKRGFNNGDAMQDWLEAEAEIDSIM